ncbi:MAG: type II CAAX endopeptidase family protein [Phycisphaerales bacterium]
MPDPTPPRAPAPEPGFEAPRPAGGAGPIAIAFALIALALAIGWQNLPEDTQRRALGLGPIPASEPLPFDFADASAIQAKVHIQAAAELDALSPGSGAQFRQQAQTATDAAAIDLGDKMAGMIVAGEVTGPDAALERLEQIQTELELAAMDEQLAEHSGPLPNAFDPFGIASGRAADFADYNERFHDALRQDIPLFETLYSLGPEALDDDERERIETRYRYLGRLALTWDMEDSAPARAELLHGGTLWRLAGLGVFFLVAIFAFFAGFVTLVFAAIWLGSGKLKPRAAKPAVHGGALLEAVGIFALLFFVMSAGTTWIAENNPALGILQLPLQWSLILVPLWPLVRGWRASEWRAAMGISRGRGVVREIAAGFVGYLAAIPLFVAGVLLSFIAMYLDVSLFGEHPVPPSNPVLDVLMDADWLVLLLVASLACVWAPLCEELIFRGALFSQVRRRFGWVLAAIASTLAFAFMHSYGPLILWPIMALGLSFAVMRWWRGSLIACITAHAIHNTTLTIMMVALSGLFPA